MKDAARQAAGRASSGRRPYGWLLTSVICAVMIGASVGVGLIIRQIRSGTVVPAPVAEAPQPVQPAQVKQVDPQPKTPEPVVEEEPPAAVEQTPAEVPQPEPVQPPMARRFGGFQQGPWNMNLTEEEQARLREGFMAMVQRFQSLSPEEQQAQMARFNAMRDRFQNMSDEERQQAMGRVQQQFDQWRQNGGSVDDLMSNLSIE